MDTNNLKAPLLVAVFFYFLLIICIPANTYSQGVKTVDPKATAKTQALYANLKKMSGHQLLFGQQDALAYGVEWKEWNKSRSDVKDVCGNHPALFGWEMSKLGSSEINIDTVNFEHMKGWMKEVYKMGGVNTISWHMDNFVTGGNSWEVGEKVVATILPGGENHDAFKKKLDVFADFVKDLRVGFIFKTDVPIIFRPFHEHTGSWFWWGADHCTPEEYKALWRFTFEYLTVEKELHNLLWAYSTDIIKDEAHYLERYPGDEYVDILGLDDYHDLSTRGSSEQLVDRLSIVTNLAQARNKVAALTETGQEAIPDTKWWTERLLNPIKSHEKTCQIAYVMVWRNARLNHHYGPFPNHSSVPDFLDFCKDPMVILEDKLPNMYRID